MAFSQWLLEQMEKYELTSYRLSKLSGVHQTTIKNILDGSRPQMETEEKIRGAFAKLSSNDDTKKSPSKSGEGDHAIDYVDDELKEYLDELRNRSEMRMLFSVTKNADKKKIEAIVKFIEELEGQK